MTQDQCSDNGHQATSNNHFTNDQVSDDLNNSINNIVSNGVNSVQEFNVDVNSKRSENRADVAIVQNRALDGDSQPSWKVLNASEQLACTSKYIASPKDIFSNRIIAINGNKRESANNNLLTDMTVITHQNSSENIREIIANSNQINKDSNDSQANEVGNNTNSEQKIINTSGVHNSGETRKKIKNESSVNGENDKPEDPVERLNKLRASISNALSEVKGVLKHYSTEQSLDGENESSPSSNEVTNDGPVRFRFVRKIRRRSAYTEDDEAFQKPENSTYAENCFRNNPVDSSGKNEYTNEEARLSKELPASKSPRETTENRRIPETQQDSTNEPPQTHELSSNIVSEPTVENHTETSDKTRAADQVNRSTTKKTKLTHQKKQHSTEEIDGSSAAIKTKSGKPKKLIKKNRRASISAVEVNQVPADETIPNLELKTQRRPSDSGTLVKQLSIGKHKSKTGEKVKVSHRQANLSSVTKIEVLETIGNSDEFTKSIRSLEKPLRSAQTKEQISVKIEDSPIKTPIDDNVSDIKPTPHQLKTEPLVKIDVSIIIDPNCVLNNPTQAYKKMVSPTQDHEETAASIEAEVPIVAKSNSFQDEPNQRIDKRVSLDYSNKSAIDKTPIYNTITLEQDQPKTTPLVKTEAPICITQLNIKPHPATKELSSLEKSNKSTHDTIKSTQNQDETANLLKTEVPIIATYLTSVTNETTQVSELTTTIKKVPVSDITEVTKHQVETVPFNIADVSNAAELSSNTVTLDKLHELTIGKSVSPAVSTTKTAPQFSNPSSISKNASATGTNKLVAIEFPEAKASNSRLLNKSKNKSYSAENNKIAKLPVVKLHEVDQVKPTADKQIPSDPDAIAPQSSSEDQASVEENNSVSISEVTPDIEPAPPKKKKKAKRKVVIRRIKRKLSKDDTFIQTQEAPPVLEIEEKEIEENDDDDEEPQIVPKQRKPCLKARQFEIGDIVMYAERYKKTQVKWKKGTVIERITSISYKLDIDGEEKPAHISYIKKFTNRKVNFGGKEYLEIDYAQIEEDEEKERNYSIWNLV